MNKKLVLLPIIFISLSSCSKTGETKKIDVESINQTIEEMRTKTFRVTFSGTQTLKYPKGYEAYNSKNDVLVTREYGYIDGNAENLRAVRQIEGDKVTTIYEENDGRYYTLAIKEDNTVFKAYQGLLGIFYRYADNYACPFDYISGEDFIEENVISSEKANFIFSSFTGLTQPVNKATFKYTDDGKLSGIDFSFAIYPIGLTGDTSIITIEQQLTGSISFGYDVENIKYTTPYEEQSNKYTSVIESLGSNYTITTDSNGLENKIVSYYADSTIFVHLNQSENAMVENDLLYIRKGTSNSYKSYLYTGVEWTPTGSVGAEKFTVPYAELDPHVIEDKADNHFAIKEDAAAYCADNFLIPHLTMTDGTGLKGDMYLKNGRIDYTNTTFYYYTGNIVVKNIYSNYGDTSLPVWFEGPAAA